MDSFFPFTRHFAMLLLTTCAAEKIYLGLLFSLTLCLPPPEPHSLPALASSIFILRLPLPLLFSFSSVLSLPMSHCVTHSMPLIHQLVLRADNGLCHIAKGKERHGDGVIEKEKKRARLRVWMKKRSEREREPGRGFLYGCGLWKCWNAAFTPNIPMEREWWEEHHGGHRFL